MRRRKTRGKLKSQSFTSNSLHKRRTLIKKAIRRTVYQRLNKLGYFNTFQTTPHKMERKKIAPAQKTLVQNPVQKTVHGKIAIQPQKITKVAHCKKRPDNNKRKGGNGASRAFIPWCERRA